MITGDLPGDFASKQTFAIRQIYERALWGVCNSLGYSTQLVNTLRAKETILLKGELFLYFDKGDRRGKEKFSVTFGPDTDAPPNAIVPLVCRISSADRLIAKSDVTHAYVVSPKKAENNAD